jgi:protoporphyrinogen IX oxidase
MDYLWIKALHVISVLSWMAGMLYLPRLFVYHATTPIGSETSETFKIMERRLLRAIINPAMIASFLFGIWMLVLDPLLLDQPWMQVKLGAVLAMTAVHGLLARWRRAFAEDRNIHSAKFYRVMNEVPTVLMIAIVIFVIVRPFE